MKHEFAGWRKIPSRMGGLKAAKCTCGWEGQPEGAGATTGQWALHKEDEEAKA